MGSKHSLSFQHRWEGGSVVPFSTKAFMGSMQLWDNDSYELPMKEPTDGVVGLASNMIFF